MNTLPQSIKKVALFLERLPGIGEKTANRLAFFLLRLPESDLKSFAVTLSELKQKTRLCKNCYNLTEAELCAICEDSARDKKTVTVVEEIADLLSFETGDIYNGIYHVLHGRIDPLNHISAEDIKIDELIARIKKDPKIAEIILATGTDMEGEATSMFIKKRLTGLSVKVTRLAYGLPIGANLEYADYMTLKKSIENRSNF